MKTITFIFEFWAKRKDCKTVTLSHIAGSRIAAYDELRCKYPSYEILYGESLKNPFLGE